MTKLQSLKKEAREGCEWRGHKMGNFQNLGKGYLGEYHIGEWRATCKVCGMDVDVNIKPSPNEIDIAGTAVALDCTK